MIYLEHTEDERSVLVPLPAETGGGGLTLVVRSAVNLTEARFAGGSRTDPRSMYAEFPVALPAGFPAGSCEYRVEEDGETVASGVAQVGEYGSGDMQYEKDTTYEQYESEDA